MKSVYIVYTVNGVEDYRIVNADSISEAKLLVKLDYPNAVIKSAREIKGVV